MLDMSNVPLYLLMYFFSVLQADPFGKMHLSLLWEEVIQENCHVIVEVVDLRSGLKM